jgi:predicted PurR-regulated permease PerM
MARTDWPVRVSPYARYVERGSGGTRAEPVGAAAERAVQAAHAAASAAEETAEARDQAVEARDTAVDAREDVLAVAADNDVVVVDERPDTLIDERRAPEHPEQYGRPGRPLGRNAPFVLGFLGALGVFLAWFLVQAVINARSVLVLIVVSAFLAVGLNPGVEWLMNRGLRRSLAVAVVFVGVISFFVGFGFAVVPPLVTQTRELVESLPALLDELQRSATIRQLDEQYDVIGRAQDYVASGALGERAFGGIVGVGRVVLGAVFSAVTVLILTLYFLASLPSIKRQTYRLVPSSRRERVRLLGDEILTRIGGYVSGAITVAGLAGVSSYLFLTIVSLDYALPLSMLVGIFALVPMVGATIAGVVVCSVGFVDSVATGLACVVFYAIYQQIENYVIYPRVMRRSVDVPAAATIMAALLGGALLGVVGALLAIPTAAAVLLVIREVWIPRQDRV